MAKLCARCGEEGNTYGTWDTDTPTCGKCYCQWRTYSEANGAITFEEWTSKHAPIVIVHGVVRTSIEIAGLQWSDDVTISYTPDGVPIDGNERHLSTSEARALAAWLNSAADNRDAEREGARAYTQRAHERGGR